MLTVLKTRPMACFPTIYKLHTAVNSDKIYAHCELNNILREKQKGCCRNSRGCKDLVIIDSIAVLQAKEHQRNFHMAYIEYK